MNHEFKINDIVEFAGSRGIITAINSNTTLSILAEFRDKHNLAHRLLFLSDGKMFSWNKEPVLKYVGREVTTEKRYNHLRLIKNEILEGV